MNLQFPSVDISSFQLAAPIETLGRIAAELQMKKLTYIGMSVMFSIFHFCW